MRHLAHELGVPTSKVAAAMTDYYEDITCASHMVLQIWFSEQESGEVAYLKMKEALSKSQLYHIATDIFGTNDERRTDREGIWAFTLCNF